MILDLNDFDESSGRVAGEETVQIDDPLAGEVGVPCRIELDYRQASGTFHFHGRVQGAVASECHRCLDPVMLTIAGEFDLVVRRSDHGGDSTDDVVMLSLHEHTVDISPAIRETILLNEPMIVVCSDECKGLCPVCGANWNRETCACSQGADPRWDALRGK